MTTSRLRRTLIAVPAVMLTLVAVPGLSQTAPHSVTQVSLSPLPPNILQFGQNITISFSYNTTEPGGVRIWARPMTTTPSGDVLTPNYAACPSPLYPTGSGGGACTLTITQGAVLVDKIRIQMYDANGTTLLFQAKLPVHYKYR
jgi:hypothetical protein